jgi:hypothetical protein
MLSIPFDEELIPSVFIIPPFKVYNSAGRFKHG